MCKLESQKFAKLCKSMRMLQPTNNPCSILNSATAQLQLLPGYQCKNLLQGVGHLLQHGTFKFKPENYGQHPRRVPPVELLLATWNYLLYQLGKLFNKTMGVVGHAGASV